MYKSTMNFWKFQHKRRGTILLRCHCFLSFFPFEILRILLKHIAHFRWLVLGDGSQTSGNHPS